MVLLNFTGLCSGLRFFSDILNQSLLGFRITEDLALQKIVTVWEESRTDSQQGDQSISFEK